jgi:hypothetical protein
MKATLREKTKYPFFFMGKTPLNAAQEQELINFFHLYKVIRFELKKRKTADKNVFSIYKPG